MEGLPCFAREMVFYSLTKFCVFQPCRKIQSLRIFDLGILEALNRDSSQRIKFLENITDSLAFPKNGVVFGEQIWHYKAFLQIFNQIRIRLLPDFKTTLQETKIQGETFSKVPRFAPFFQKNGFAFAEQILYFER